MDLFNNLNVRVSYTRAKSSLLTSLSYRSSIPFKFYDKCHQDSDDLSPIFFHSIGPFTCPFSYSLLV